MRRIVFSPVAMLLIIIIGASAIVGCRRRDAGSDHASALAVWPATSPDHVSGGDVLVYVKSAFPDVPAVSVNGHDVSDAFGQDPWDPDQLVGLVTGLVNGPNTITVTHGDQTSTVEVTNYPSTGPIVSGPHITPFVCQTESFRLPDGTPLGVPLDDLCSAATVVQYVYLPTTGEKLVPLPSLERLPDDVRMTTTTEGHVVPFVARVETGTMGRGIYQNVILHDPTSEDEPSPTNPPRFWNRKLIAVHGSGCPGGWYIQGAAMGVDLLAGDQLTRLGEGYASFTNTLNHPTNSCNALLAGEVTVMGKEHFVETFGPPEYTVSTGGRAERIRASRWPMRFLDSSTAC